MKFAFVCGALCSASIAALAVPTVASAAILVSGSVTGIDVPSDPGLALEASAIAFADFSLNNVGDTFTTDVLRIGTRENTVNLADDLVPQPVSATFTFSSPAGAGGTANGSSSGFYRLFSQCGVIAGGCGRVDWVNPTIFNFGNGGAFSVTLSNVEFRTPGAANVSARFELLSNAVPEPSTWAMLILGFGVVGGALRSQRKVVSPVTYA